MPNHTVLYVRTSISNISHFLRNLFIHILIYLLSVVTQTEKKRAKLEFSSSFYETFCITVPSLRPPQTSAKTEKSRNQASYLASSLHTK